MGFLFFCFYVTFCIVVSVIADSRDRSPVKWFFLATAISPLLALILVLALPPLDAPYRPGVRSDREIASLGERGARPRR